ncbi:hypothetical protein IPH92_04250 [Candidatus Kaiserbacteria bacterium]|nr:MAG: hypothetical protein IPH92_04250 [Candidatus Kaiserbacteria bacterium]
MDFLNKFNLTNAQILKFAGLALLGFIGLTIFINVFSNGLGMSGNTISMPQGTPYASPDMYYGEAKQSNLSIRNVTGGMEPQVEDSYTSGDDGEAYEVKEYGATIETRNHEIECAAVHALKARTDVIFQNANEYDRGCSYVFKVKKESVEEILGIVKELNPKELTEASYTIQKEVEDYTSEIQILQNKLASLDKTLADAILSYENITALATNAGNVDSLAKIIESKLTIIERLTSARIETSNSLERMNRSKAEALDRLLYTYFTVSVYENKFVDGEEITNSWKVAVQQFVRDTNNAVQDISIGLVYFMLMIVKIGLYFVIGLFAVRFAWMFAKRIWKSGEGA